MTLVQLHRQGERRVALVHVHYFGACALTFGDGFLLEDADVMIVEFAGFGRALRNRISVATTPHALVHVLPLA